MIQGEIVEAKFLALKGPKGTYSHNYISLADQSFKMKKPKTWSKPYITLMGLPISDDLPIIAAISISKSSFLVCDQTPWAI